jgi:hypothetical protein
MGVVHARSYVLRGRADFQREFGQQLPLLCNAQINLFSSSGGFSGLFFRCFGFTQISKGWFSPHSQQQRRVSV